MVETLYLFQGYLQNINSFTLCLIILLLTAVFIIYTQSQSEGLLKLPPGPPRLPVIGSIPWIDRSNPIGTFKKWAKQYGPIVTFYIGSKRNVIVNDAKLAKDLLIKQGGVILENGEDWKRHRRWLVTSLRFFGMGKRSIEEQISVEARQLCHSIQQEDGGKFYPLTCVLNAVSNIICSMSFGKRYEYDDPKFQNLLDDVNAYFKYTHFARIEEAIPFLMRFHSKRYKYVNNIIAFLKSHVKEHIDTFDENNIRDIIDMLLLQFKQDASAENDAAKTESPNTESGSSDAKKDASAAGKSANLGGKTASDDINDVWRAILGLFLAGTETTTSTIMWFLLYMICYPDVQQRIKDEIESATGGERPLTLQDKPKVPYFEATICEVQRLSNIAAVLIPHNTTADTVVNGYDIPANTTFNINLSLIHMDPKYWENPAEFKPDRFLDSDGKTFIKHDILMPFGVGRRSCLGESLGKMEIYIFASRLLQSFTFELPECSPRPSFEPVIGITYTPQYFEVVAKHQSIQSK
ncbi:cytochrome P450 2B5-like isoform X2 [Antedon mediterranea]|uniref:cytochrome P450 2B5-like isoform X2 n=1 Tax=Antedon mediterranea TaxID=105859 RepID=UPI003AF64A8A